MNVRFIGAFSAILVMSVSACIEDGPVLYTISTDSGGDGAAGEAGSSTSSSLVPGLPGGRARKRGYWWIRFRRNALPIARPSSFRGWLRFLRGTPTQKARCCGTKSNP